MKLTKYFTDTDTNFFSRLSTCTSSNIEGTCHLENPLVIWPIAGVCLTSHAQINFIFVCVFFVFSCQSENFDLWSRLNIRKHWIWSHGVVVNGLSDKVKVTVSSRWIKRKWYHGSKNAVIFECYFLMSREIFIICNFLLQDRIEVTFQNTFTYGTPNEHKSNITIQFIYS